MNSLATATWKDGPEGVLDKVNHQLLPFGLRVSLIVFGTGLVEWEIVRITEKAPTP